MRRGKYQERFYDYAGHRIFFVFTHFTNIYYNHDSYMNGNVHIVIFVWACPGQGCFTIFFGK